MPVLQILSDLHLESPQAYDIFQIPPKAPYLALLGDIGYATKHEGEYYNFLRQQLARFRVVFLVLGNHEPWHSNWDVTRARMRHFEHVIKRERENTCNEGAGNRNNTTGTAPGKFVLLDQTRYDIQEEGDADVTILGCTLFSRVPLESLDDVSFGLQDFYKTDDWTVEKHNARFEEELAWLNAQVSALRSENRRVVIFTHYSPTPDKRAVDPKHGTSRIQAGFSTDLRGQLCWESECVKLWAFGHTHFNCDFVDEKTQTRVLAHQRGYYSHQAKGFDVEKIVEI
ncbi:Ser/Thr protein phosphatase superfamily [Xylaria grammica]|nr:Ser/Thr protein phosphatase superfamily [Xylaria grammica]